MKISVVIAAYNEESSVEELVRRVQASSYPKEIIIVDDGSTDGTLRILEKIAAGSAEKNICILAHEKNQGKGAALRTGFAHVTGDFVIVQDADLEYDPKEYPVLLEPLIDGRADVVYGSRFLGGPHRVLFFWHYVGNTFLTLLSNAFTNLNLTDMETCYKAFRASILKEIHLKQNRFGFEPEFTVKIARAKQKYRIYEVPISYSGRDYSQGKKITWKDGFVAMAVIVWYRFFE